MDKLKILKAENVALKKELAKLKKRHSIFADRLKFARQKMKMTQKELAEKLGLSQNGYSPYETGQRLKNVKILIKMADILNVSLDWLCGRTDNES